MKIIQALLGEHGAMYPLLDLIENTAPLASLDELKVRASCLRSILLSHAGIEEAVLRPAIEQHLPKAALLEDGTPAPTDHQVIDAGLAQVLTADQVEGARRLLLDTVLSTRKHFAKEEKIIFGIAERELSQNSQEQMGAHWACRRGVFVGLAGGNPTEG